MFVKPAVASKEYKSVADFLDQNAKYYKVVTAALRTARAARAEPKWLDFNGTFFLPNDAAFKNLFRSIGAFPDIRAELSKGTQASVSGLMRVIFDVQREFSALIAFHASQTLIPSISEAMPTATSYTKSVWMANGVMAGVGRSKDGKSPLIFDSLGRQALVTGQDIKAGGSVIHTINTVLLSILKFDAPIAAPPPVYVGNLGPMNMDGSGPLTGGVGGKPNNN